MFCTGRVAPYGVPVPASEQLRFTVQSCAKLGVTAWANGVFGVMGVTLKLFNDLNETGAPNCATGYDAAVMVGQLFDYTLTIEAQYTGCADLEVHRFADIQGPQLRLPSVWHLLGLPMPYVIAEINPFTGEGGVDWGMTNARKRKKDPRAEARGEQFESIEKRKRKTDKARKLQERKEAETGEDPTCKEEVVRIDDISKSTRGEKTSFRRIKNAEEMRRDFFEEE